MNKGRRERGKDRYRKDGSRLRERGTRREEEWAKGEEMEGWMRDRRGMERRHTLKGY